MKAYLNILDSVIREGHQKGDRTGTGTVSKFAVEFRHDLRNGFPLLTTKKINPRQVFGELVGFLKGFTTLEEFHSLDCNIWDKWGLKKDYVTLRSTRLSEQVAALAEKLNINPIEAEKMLRVADAEVTTFTATRQQRLFEITTAAAEELAGLGKSEEYRAIYVNDKIAEYLKTQPKSSADILREHGIQLMATDVLYSKGDLGPIYGEQWLNWITAEGVAINQLVVNAGILATNPNSRRMVVLCWNPAVVPKESYDVNPISNTGVECSADAVEAAICDGKQALPPCHLMFILNTHTETDGTRILNLQLIMRSTDVPVGLPFNIASYAALQEIIAKKHGMVAGELVINMTDCHVYNDQIELAKEQLSRTPTALPKFELDDVIDYTNPESLSIETVDQLCNAIKGYEHQAFIKYPVSV